MLNIENSNIVRPFCKYLFNTTINIPKQRPWHCSRVFIVDFGLALGHCQISMMKCFCENG